MSDVCVLWSVRLWQGYLWQYLRPEEVGWEWWPPRLGRGPGRSSPCSCCMRAFSLHSPGPGFSSQVSAAAPPRGCVRAAEAVRQLAPCIHRARAGLWLCSLCMARMLCCRLSCSIHTAIDIAISHPRCQLTSLFCMRDEICMQGMLPVLKCTDITLHGQSTAWTLTAPPSGLSDLVSESQLGDSTSNCIEPHACMLGMNEKGCKHILGSVHLALLCAPHAACAGQLVSAFALSQSPRLGLLCLPLGMCHAAGPAVCSV